MEMLYMIILILFIVLTLITKGQYNKWARIFTFVYGCNVLIFSVGSLVTSHQEKKQAEIYEKKEKEKLIQELTAIDKEIYKKRDVVEYIPEGLTYTIGNKVK